MLQVLTARWYEQFFGQRAASHLCVSTAMQHFLRAKWGIAATVLRDTPPHWFHRTSLRERHELFTRLAADLNGPTQVSDVDYIVPNPYSQQHGGVVQGKDQHELGGDVSHSGRNVFTHVVGGQPQLRTDRPALIVSSTSWTVDEDFQIMLDAAVCYEEVSIRLLLSCRPPTFILCPIHKCTMCLCRLSHTLFAHSIFQCTNVGFGAQACFAQGLHAVHELHACRPC